MNRRYVVRLDPRRRPPPDVGTKAESLWFLMRHGFEVPPTFVCPWTIRQAWEQESAGVLSALRQELARVLPAGGLWAVRSSASVEDGAELSYAGQFLTLLNVQGADGVVEAIQSVWKSAEGAGRYARRGDTGGTVPEMAVVIQRMVDAGVAGVAFSRDPITSMDQVVVEAVLGSGDALVQSGATPRRWVSKWGKWLEIPDDNLVSLALIDRVVREAKAIARAFGAPADLEWAYDGERLYWLQLRRITTIGKVSVYSNRMARAMLPGAIKPLVWSVNIPLVGGVWVDLLTELIGPNDLRPESLVRAFHYHAYFDVTALGAVYEALGLPREAVELTLGIEDPGPDRPRFQPTRRTLILLPRIVAFLYRRMMTERAVSAFLPASRREFATFRPREAAALDEKELLREIDRLYALVKPLALYNKVVQLMHSAYTRALSGMMARGGLDFGTLDPTGGSAELERFDPSPHLEKLRAEYRQLPPEMQCALRDDGAAALSREPQLRAIGESLARFLADFGHLSESGTDFSSVPWREDPDAVLRAIADERAGAQAPRPLRGAYSPSARGIDRLLLDALLRRARRFRVLREELSFTYIQQYGAFRDYFLALGSRLAARGEIRSPDDVFFLAWDEVRKLAAEPGSDGYWREVIARRRSEYEASQGLALPTVVIGDEPVLPSRARTSRLSGTATSRGYYEGHATVVRSLGDFGRVRDGDVLVIPFSDVSWTPLFGRIGAVVSESGGILSHASIVAREFGIPAVTSVGGALDIPDGALVAVDGYRGEVGILGAAEVTTAS